MPHGDMVDAWCEFPNIELLQSRNQWHLLRDDFQEHHELMQYLIVSDGLQKGWRRALKRLGQKDGVTRHADWMASQEVLQKLSKWRHGEVQIVGDQGPPTTPGRHHREERQAEHERKPAALPDLQHIGAEKPQVN